MKSKSLTFISIIVLIGTMMFAESIISPLLMALFISIIVVPPIQWLVRKKIPQPLAVSIMIVVLIGLYIGFFELAGSSISLFIENAPRYQGNIDEITKNGILFLGNNGIDVTTLGSEKAFDPSKIVQYTSLFLSSIGDVMSSEFTFLFLTIFLLFEIEDFILKIEALVKGNTNTRSNLTNMGEKIRHYLSIKTVTSLLTGGLISLGLFFIGVDYPILWGLVAFLLNYIPNIGSIIAAIPAIVFSLIQLGVGGTTWTVMLFVAVNIIIGNVVEPRMMGKGLGLSTFMVFLSLLVWGFILGPVGMFLSVPLTMVIKVALEQNQETKFIAVLLGTKEDAQKFIMENTKTHASQPPLL
jgi:predicted PurR-regulated permease PerM